jgi:hypothetical protein
MMSSGQRTKFESSPSWTCFDFHFISVACPERDLPKVEFQISGSDFAFGGPYSDFTTFHDRVGYYI